MSSSSRIIIKQSPSSEIMEAGNGGDNLKRKAAATTTTTTTSNDNENRLAPFSPTHSTAQSKALDLLRPTHRDVFFDLGCGDGRLVIAALEKCYDDDYLMKVHQERFAKLHLSPSKEEEPAEDRSGCPDLQQLLSSFQADEHQHHQRQQQQQPQLPPRTHVRKNSAVSFSSGNPRVIGRARSHSTEYSAVSVTIPHLMARCDDSASDATSIVSGVSSTAQQLNQRHNHRGNNGGLSCSGHLSNGSFNNLLLAAGNIDPLSSSSAARSPSSHERRVALSLGAMPNSPETPVACNRNVTNGYDDELLKRLYPLPYITTTTTTTTTPLEDDDDDNNNERQQHPIMKDYDRLQTPPATADSSSLTSDGLPGIPKTIETPSPDGRRGSYHCPQISELPTDYSSFVDQILSTVPSGEVMVTTTTITSSNSYDEGIGSDDDDDDRIDEIIENNQYNNGSHDTTTNGGDTIIGGVDISGLSTTRTTTLGGLQCVGIEYNQGLAEQAEVNVSKSYIYPHVENRVCIRWGDVLDEWNRGRGGGSGSGSNDEPGMTIVAENGIINNENSHYLSDITDDLAKKGLIVPSIILPGGQGNNCLEYDASSLTLLDDATAVFVYLLPKGLKKVKALLHEAAVLRKQQQEKQQQQHKQQQQIQQREQQNHPLHHPLYHPLQQQSLVTTNNITLPTIEGSGNDLSPSCPLPHRLVNLQHRKGHSHVSDITDYDESPLGFGSIKRLREEEGVSNNNNVNTTTAAANNGLAAGIIEAAIPSFRVVSYMFSIPGWTPSVVDRSSKGGCPLYLYENIHEEE